MIKATQSYSIKLTKEEVLEIVTNYVLQKHKKIPSSIDKWERSIWLDNIDGDMTFTATQEY